VKILSYFITIEDLTIFSSCGIILTDEEKMKRLRKLTEARQLLQNARIWLIEKRRKS
jgi:hypothetical protein